MYNSLVVNGCVLAHLGTMRVRLEISGLFPAPHLKSNKVAPEKSWETGNASEPLDVISIRKYTAPSTVGVCRENLRACAC